MDRWFMVYMAMVYKSTWNRPTRWTFRGQHGVQWASSGVGELAYRAPFQALQAADGRNWSFEVCWIVVDSSPTPELAHSHDFLNISDCFILFLDQVRINLFTNWTHYHEGVENRSQKMKKRQKSKRRKKNKANWENVKTTMQLGGAITHLRYTWALF